MRALSSALYNRMATDPALTDKLGKLGSAPAIFTKRPIPDAATRPIIVAATIVSDVDADILVTQGREIQRDIAVYGAAPAQYEQVVDAAERVRELFHRYRLPVPGWRTVSIRARGPIDAPAEPQEIGRVVTLLIRLHQPN